MAKIAFNIFSLLTKKNLYVPDLSEYPKIKEYTVIGYVKEILSTIIRSLIFIKK